jgi:hypothetical protein
MSTSRIGIAALSVWILLAAEGASGFQLAPQALNEKLQSEEFAIRLKEVLRFLKLGTVASLDPITGKQSGGAIPAAFSGAQPSSKIILPGAGVCELTEVFYRCEWETVPNAASVAVISDSLSQSVAGVLPAGWKAQRADQPGMRITEFTDPAGEVVITIKCSVPLGGLRPATGFTAWLMIHPAGLRM